MQKAAWVSLVFAQLWTVLPILGTCPEETLLATLLRVETARSVSILTHFPDDSNKTFTDVQTDRVCIL